MPEVDGLEVLKRIRAADPNCQVILMTGHASIDTAIDAIKHGAMDYLSKPFDFDRLQHLLTGIHDQIEQRRALLETEGRLVKQLEFCGMVGRSAAMLELFDRIRRFAPHVRTALVTGETGTGKELVARALHKAGPRANRKFATVNCSAVVETLFESELFGHVRGAFTGAVDSKPGLFEAADGARSFWTRSASCHCRCRQSCCARSKLEKYSAWAGSTRAASTSAWLRRPTAIFVRSRRKAASGKICFIV
jgi:DNA-binding NtrC family response regulator